MEIMLVSHTFFFFSCLQAEFHVVDFSKKERSQAEYLLISTHFLPSQTSRIRVHVFFQTIIKFDPRTCMICNLLAEYSVRLWIFNYASVSLQWQMV